MQSKMNNLGIFIWWPWDCGGQHTTATLMGSCFIVIFSFFEKMDVLFHCKTKHHRDQVGDPLAEFFFDLHYFIVICYHCASAATDIAVVIIFIKK